MFGLLNANARLYSPYLGRFVSPDPLLNCEGGAWDYNPYVYARNNPYKYIDRNGEFWWLAIPIWMGFANAFTNFDNINNAGDFFRCFGADFSSWKGVLYTCGAIAGTTALCIAMPYAIPFVASALGVTAESAIAYAATSALAGTISYFTDEALNSAIYGTPFKFSWNKWAFTTISWTAMGAYEGYAQAKAKGLNGWTGKSKVMSPRHKPDMTGPDAMAPLPKDDLPIYSHADPADVLEQARIQTGQGTSSVYVGKDANNVIRYVGRTDRAPEIRFGEHFRDGRKSVIVKFETITNTLDHNGSRVAEQVLINKYGLQKDGGQLINKINSISPKHWDKHGVNRK